MGHSMSDPVHGVYRTKEDVEEAEGNGPDQAASSISSRENDLLTDEELQAMDAEVQEEVDDAAEFADNSPEPPDEALYEHVYADMDVHGRLFFDRMNRLEEV